MTVRDPGQLHLLFAEFADPDVLAELTRSQCAPTRSGSLCSTRRRRDWQTIRFALRASAH
jgi:hypothetical protein